MLLKLNNIKKVFNKNTIDEVTLFDGFNLEVKGGDFISVVGSNGSGKTTLLNLICGSDFPDSGSIFFDGCDITNTQEYVRAKYISRVYQNTMIGTCGDLTILENLCLADNKNKKYNLSLAIDKNRIDYYRDLLKTCDMGLEERMNTPVGLLSGGQRQALSLIIAEMTNAKLIILDEHTAALDPNSSKTIMKLTNKMIVEKSKTAIMVTHNLLDAVNYGNRIVMLDKGKIILDKSGKDKKETDLNSLLKIFDNISIESGN